MTPGLAAVALLFFAGVLARRLGWLSRGHGDLLLRIVVAVGLPALIVGSISRLHVDSESVRLPLVAILSALTLWPLALVSGRVLRLDRPAQGAFLASALSMNLAFVFPFASVAGGAHALAKFVLFDVGNALFQWTALVFLTARYAGHSMPIWAALGRVLHAPPFWAILVAATLNVSGIALSGTWFDVLRDTGRFVLLAAPFAVGLLADFSLVRSKPVWIAAFIRSAIGAAVGFVLGLALDLQREDLAVAALGAGAPIGFTAVILSVRERLDAPLAAGAAAISAAAGALWLPAAIRYALG
jgi:predicted permease